MKIGYLTSFLFYHRIPIFYFLIYTFINLYVVFLYLLFLREKTFKSFICLSVLIKNLNEILTCWIQDKTFFSKDDCNLLNIYIFSALYIFLSSAEPSSEFCMWFIFNVCCKNYLTLSNLKWIQISKNDIIKCIRY